MNKSLCVSRRLPKPLAVSNSAFWNSPAVVLTQQREAPWSHTYEDYLLDLARNRCESGRNPVKVIHVIGCGPGREIPVIRKVFPEARVIASDVAQRMIDVCAENLLRWDCSANVELICCPASSLAADRDGADLVVAFNNVLTYISEESERRRTFGAMRGALRAGGLLIGVVHHRWGRPAKSCYFLLQQIARMVRLTTREAGYRLGGFAGMRARCHYYTAAELRVLLAGAGFAPLEILSLAFWHRKREQKYNPLRGDNNLIFAAEAR